MKYLAVSVVAVLLAVLLNWFSTAINFLIIIVLLSIVLIWLFYQAQLLPEDTMAYFDNRIIHDGQVTIKTTSDDKTNTNNNEQASLETDNFHEEDIQEVESRISPDQELLNLVLEKSKDLDIEIQPLDELSLWVSTIDPTTAEREIVLLIEKLNQAAGLSNKVKIRFNGESLEVQV